jgi:hypothetical protein
MTKLENVATPIYESCIHGILLPSELGDPWCIVVYKDGYKPWTQKQGEDLKLESNPKARSNFKRGI